MKQDDTVLPTDARFLFCVGFILFSITAFCMELFVYGGIVTSKTIITIMYRTFLAVNVAVNFLYLYAVLRIARREEVLKLKVE